MGETMTTETAATILLIDDHPMLRNGVKQLIGMDPRLQVIAEAGNGEQGVSLAEEHDPDLILLDLNMKGLSGLDTLKALRNEGVDARIIVLTVSDSRNDVYALIDAGADGYLLKDSEPEQLLEHIRSAAEGQNVISDAVADYLLSRSEQHNPFAELTERELDVLQEVARGLSNKQVAAQLHISEETVKVHIRNMLRKLDVRSRVAATVMYLEHRSQ